MSGYRFPIDWTFGIPQPEKRNSKQLKLDYYRKQLLSLLPGSYERDTVLLVWSRLVTSARIH